MILYLWFVMLTLVVPCLADKRALLVGVNDYTKGPAEWDLRGCENDVAMTRQLLVDKFGFPEQNIKVLVSGEATAGHILQAIQDWLVTPVKPEDIVYFHFSGHGSQVKDFEGDEEDGYDEVICPSDMQQGVWASIITDDQLRVALDQIPARQVTIVLDACHSGTGTRDLSLSRPRFVAFDPGEGKGKGTRGLSVPEPPAPAGAAVSVLPGAANKRWVTISGCRPDQTSADAWIRDGFYAGALTYHLVDEMKKAPPGTTVRALIEEVGRDLQAASYSQIPQVEGDVDQPLLGPSPESQASPQGRVNGSGGKQGGKLKLLLEAPDEQQKKVLAEALSELDFVEVAPEGVRFDHRLQLSAIATGWQGILTTDGKAGEPVQGGDMGTLVTGLRPQLENVYAVKFLAGLDNPAPPFSVSVWVDHGKTDQASEKKFVQAKVGEVIRFNFRADRDCYLTLIDLGTSGKITVLFPNQYQPDGFIKAWQTYQTGTQGVLPFQVRAMGPAGRELVKVIATADSLTLPSLKLGKTGAAGTRSIEEGSEFVKQLTRDLAAESNEETPQQGLLTTGAWATDYLIVETAP